MMAKFWGLIVFVILFLSISGFAQDTQDTLPAPYIESYQQELLIAFGSEEAAARAEIQAMPLPDNKQIAFTSRWDDDRPDDNQRMAELHDKFGFVSTYYLNGNPQKDRVYRAIIEKGHAIGGHGVTHPHLAWCSRNRMFEEVARNRAELEAFVDAPVCSYAFSFMSMYFPPDGVQSSLDIAEVLFRSGFYEVSNARFGKITGLSTPMAHLVGAGTDPEDFFQHISRVNQNRDALLANPCYAIGIHAWQYNNAKMAGLRKVMEQIKDKPEWWYCNQNEYGAYRIQYQNTLIEKEPDGKFLRLKLTRPVLADLNNPTSLSLQIAGVSPDEVMAVDSRTAKADLYKKDGLVWFNLNHDDTQSLPKKIAWLHNEDNTPAMAKAQEDRDFRRIKANAWVENNQLHWGLRNDSGRALLNVRVHYRLPLQYQAVAKARKIDMIKNDFEHRDSIALNRASSDYKYTYGKAFYLVEINFTRDNQRGRIHLSVSGEEKLEPDSAFPNRGFTRLGPIPHDQIDINKVMPIVQGNSDAYTLDSGEALGFAPIEAGMEPYDKKMPLPAGFLDPEIVRTAGITGYNMTEEAEKYAGVYLLASVMEASEATSAYLLSSTRPEILKAIFVNGQAVQIPRQGKRLTPPQITLQKGMNRILIAASVVEEPAFLADNMGIPLRLVNPEGQKISGIQYHPKLRP